MLMAQGDIGRMLSASQGTVIVWKSHDVTSVAGGPAGSLELVEGRKLVADNDRSAAFVFFVPNKVSADIDAHDGDCRQVRRFRLH